MRSKIIASDILYFGQAMKGYGSPTKAVEAAGRPPLMNLFGKIIGIFRPSALTPFFTDLFEFNLGK